MKRLGNLYEQVFADDNIKLAIKRASIGKTKRTVFKYANEHEEEIIEFVKNNPNYKGIAKELERVDKASGKIRNIKVPDYKNLIIQHCLMQIVYPILSKSFYFHSYGALPNKGMFKASKAVKRMVKPNRYYIQCDIVKYYESIDREILMELMSRKIKDKRVLELLKPVNPKGLPIGNYTSQIMANFYLTPLDHYVKEILMISEYVRNMDDFIIFGTSKRELWKQYLLIKDFLETKLKLSIHEERVKIRGISDTEFVDFCGYKNYKDHTTLRKRTYRRVRKLMFKLHRFLREKWVRSFFSYWGFITKTNCHKWLAKYMPMINMANMRKLISLSMKGEKI